MEESEFPQSSTLPRRPLTRGQKQLLFAGTVPMVLVAGLGAWGTFTNALTVFPDNEGTAAGLVAAGEGTTFVLAIVFVGLTLLGQSAPMGVRVGLWALPAIASAAGMVIAPTPTEAVVFGITPLAMCLSAEGLGLLARRIVIYTTGIDMEAQRRNAAITRKMNFQYARAQKHPVKKVRKQSELKAWKLLERVGADDVTLGEDLVTVQRERVTQGADTALKSMFVTDGPSMLSGGVTDNAPALDTPGTPELPAGNGERDGDTADGAPTGGARKGGTPLVTQVNDADTEQGKTPSRFAELFVMVEEIAAVRGVPVPETDTGLTNEQIELVLRALRYDEDPPVSYRAAIDLYRDAGYVGSEKRLRRIWAELLIEEEPEDATETGA